VKLRGQWVNVDPTAWKTKRDCKISVGVGAGNKESMLANLAMTIQMQMALAPVGVARPENIYNALLEQMKLQGFSNPAKFWTDPKANPAPPQKPPEIAIKEMELQADQQRFQAETVVDQQKMKQEAALAQQEAEMKVQFELQKAQIDAELEKYKADLQALTTIQVEQMKLGGQMHLKEAELGQERELAQFNAQSTDRLEEKKIRLTKEPDQTAAETASAAVTQIANEFLGKLGETSRSIQTMLTMPKRIKRGRDGRVEGLEVIGPDGMPVISQNVVRGPNGMIEGVE
jgi:hypothetical protein